MKEEFVLPEKWCIKRTPETWEFITNYFNETYGRTYMMHNPKYPYVSNNFNANDSFANPYGKYEEISFDQFLKYEVYKKDLPKEDNAALIKLLKNLNLT